MPEKEINLQGRAASVLRFPARRAAPPVQAVEPPAPGATAYAELHCISNFSFQRGASHPDELVLRALELGYTAMALTDECSVGGTVRGWDGLRQFHKHFAETWRKDHPDAGDPPEPPTLQLLYGAEFALEDGARLVAIARHLDGWGGLCQSITAARMAADKGDYDIAAIDWSLLAGCERIYLPARGTDHARVQAAIDQARERFGAQGLWLGVQLLCDFDDDLWLALLQQAGESSGLPLLACGDVHMHAAGRKPLQDVISAVREGRTVGECGWALQRNAQRYLRPLARLA